ncbi:MAG: cell division protein FtsA [Candidatus Marinimicrobia bacterium]|nr:cell division protein FtsA [Candidatus Neomarinimicrobiota bacterium]|tara:strand:+ start:403 stop:1644 length:1242 start_codon:yes stop_codon:yes gene_type:complete
MRNKIQIAFDLGSHSIKSAVGRILPDGKIEVLSLAEIQSNSIDCGDIIDKDLLLSHLEILVEKMEKDAKINIDEDAWVSVSGRGIRSINSSTRIRSRENTDFDIDEEIKQKLLNQCSDVQVSSDRYVLHNIEQGYFIGNSPLIRNPIGMIGKSIDAKAHVIHVRNFNLTQLDNCFNEDLSIEPFPVFDGYAAASSNLTHDEKDLGVIFVDIGSDKTNILIFKDNYLIHSKVIPLGSRLVSKDMAAYLQSSLKEAERLKVNYVSAFSEFADESKKIEVEIPNDDLKKNINEKEISKIVELRFEDIIDQIEVQINSIGCSINDFKSGIKISGGGSKIRNLDLLFKKHFKDIPVEFMKINNIIFKENLEDRREFITLFGLLAWPIHNVEDKSSTLQIKDMSGIRKSISTLFKGIFE